MFRLQRVSACLASGILVLLLPAANGFAAVISPVIPVATQQGYNWCWAASDAMVLNHFNNPISQCQVVSNALNNPGCCPPSPGHPSCDVLGESTIPDSRYSRTYQSLYGSLSWTMIQAGINANRPFIFTWIWSDGTSHIMVGVGYHITDRGRVGWVDYNNPLNASGEMIRFLQFGSAPDHTSGKTYYDIQ